MNFSRLVIRNLEGRPFRNWVVFLCSGLVAFFVVVATILIGGARSSLRLVLDRLGADIIVVPNGAESKLENAFLMGAPAKIWMSSQVAEEVARVPGVSLVSSQVFLSTLVGVGCCAIPEMFLIAYDPATDFTLKPWLDAHLHGDLAVGEAIGGSFVFVPKGADNILIYGFEVKLKANLERTGTGLDQSMFLSMETAREIARVSITRAVEPLVIPKEAVSAVMVRVDSAQDPHQVAEQIGKSIPGVVPVESSNLFQTHRGRINGLSTTLLALIAVAWALSVVLIGLIFSMVINDRKREIGVMRALGATRPAVLASVLWEGLLLGLFGGMAGIGLGLLGVYFLRTNLVEWLGIPFIFPSSQTLVGLVGLGLGLAELTVFTAVILPAVRISTMDPVEAMRK